MEQSFTIDGLNSDFILGDLKGEIIDYIISSYRVNLNLIYLYFWHPKLQIHCQETYGGTGKEDFVTLHKIEKPGIYHAKFILVTTKEMLKLIIMTTNITENIVKECLNDYYVIKIPKCKLSRPTQFTMNLYQFLDAFNIKLKRGLLQYQWKGVKGKLLVSIPYKLSHSTCFKEQIKKPKKNYETEAEVSCSSMMSGFDIKKIFKVKTCKFYYSPENAQKGFGVIDIEHNVNKDKKENYEMILRDENVNFHYKRYTIKYFNPKKKKLKQYLIITSANLTRQAWGTNKKPSLNAELGIIWNSKKIFN